MWKVYSASKREARAQFSAELADSWQLEARGVGFREKLIAGPSEVRTRTVSQRVVLRHLAGCLTDLYVDEL